ncbi:MAG: DUF948 domain-containing protein [Candidatus Rokuibacteriota bacterium]
MSPWWQILLILCAIALTVALVGAIMAMRRTLQRLEQVFAVLEVKLGPTLEDVRGLTQEAQAVTRDARSSVARLSAMIEHINQVTESVGTFVIGLRGLTQVGQLVGIAMGVKKGVNVFMRRLGGPRRGQHHG